MGDVVLLGPDRRKPYRVAARGAGLTMLVVAVVSAARADDIPAWLNAVSAERSFYPVAAQIIPVFLLTFAVERSFFGNSKELPGAYRFSDVTLGFCLVVGGSGVAEFLCLWVSAFAPGVVAAASATLLTSGTAVGALLLIVGVAWQGLSPPPDDLKRLGYLEQLQREDDESMQEELRRHLDDLENPIWRRRYKHGASAGLPVTRPGNGGRPGVKP